MYYFSEFMETHLRRINYIGKSFLLQNIKRHTNIFLNKNPLQYRNCFVLIKLLMQLKFSSNQSVGVSNNLESL